MSDSTSECLKRFNEGTYSFQDLKILIDYFQKEKKFLEMRKVRIAAKLMQLSAVVKSGRPLRICILATSDDEKDEFRKYAWGDYWLQYELTCSLGRYGFVVTRDNPHIVLHLFGFPRRLIQNTYNIVWCTSHPELLTLENLFHYDHVFSLSAVHAERLKNSGVEADYLPGASSKTPYPDKNQKYPAVFVGNTKPGQGMRSSVFMLKESGYPFLVWGWGWEEYLPQENIAGNYFDYLQIDRLFAQSAFVLNDHHPIMTEMEMVSPKNFDICSSGGFLVCERNPGLDSLFESSIPQFSTTDELRRILFGLHEQPEKREEQRERMAKISQTYTFDLVVEKIYNHCLMGQMR